jgi:hypothetical protein
MIIDEILNFCEKHKKAGKYSVYRTAKQMLEQLNPTPDEYEAAIQEIAKKVDL